MGCLGQQAGEASRFGRGGKKVPHDARSRHGHLHRAEPIEASDPIEHQRGDLDVGPGCADPGSDTLALDLRDEDESAHGLADTGRGAGRQGLRGFQGGPRLDRRCLEVPGGGARRAEPVRQVVVAPVPRLLHGLCLHHSQSVEHHEQCPAAGSRKHEFQIHSGFDLEDGQHLERWHRARGCVWLPHEHATPAVHAEAGGAERPGQQFCRSQLSDIGRPPRWPDLRSEEGAALHDAGALQRARRDQGGAR
mmetsp:Transcript_128653/g.412126  ORF Transcript_128653/g.412126 Transcript_128653/m.412126 type:complete len:249 (+) Transcript_128653:647-1393(+)